MEFNASDIVETDDSSTASCLKGGMKLQGGYDCVYVNYNLVNTKDSMVGAIVMAVSPY